MLDAFVSAQLCTTTSAHLSAHAPHVLWLFMVFRIFYLISLVFSLSTTPLLMASKLPTVLQLVSMLALFSYLMQRSASIVGCPPRPFYKYTKKLIKNNKTKLWIISTRVSLSTTNVQRVQKSTAFSHHLKIIDPQEFDAWTPDTLTKAQRWGLGYEKKVILSTTVVGNNQKKIRNLDDEKSRENINQLTKKTAHRRIKHASNIVEPKLR